MMLKLGNILNEINSNIPPKILGIATGISYDEFLTKTDSLTRSIDILYRGSDTLELRNEIFMTDYIGHVREYGDVVNGILVNFSIDLLRIDDVNFDNLRRTLSGITKSDILRIYSTTFNRGISFSIDGKHMDNKSVIGYVLRILKSNDKFSSFQKNFDITNLLTPLMLHYVNTRHKNIIVFNGNDYASYGGQDEYVVSDVSRYATLRHAWETANA
jgi:hypothetical protein